MTHLAKENFKDFPLHNIDNVLPSQWAKLSYDGKEKTLQDIANRYAEIEGRKAPEVYTFNLDYEPHRNPDKPFLEPDIQKKIIGINDRHITDNHYPAVFQVLTAMNLHYAIGIADNFLASSTHPTVKERLQRETLDLKNRAAEENTKEYNDIYIVKDAKLFALQATTELKIIHEKAGEIVQEPPKKEVKSSHEIDLTKEAIKLKPPKLTL